MPRPDPLPGSLLCFAYANRGRHDHPCMQLEHTAHATSGATPSVQRPWRARRRTGGHPEGPQDALGPTDRHTDTDGHRQTDRHKHTHTAASPPPPLLLHQSITAEGEVPFLCPSVPRPPALVPCLAPRAASARRPRPPRPGRTPGRPFRCFPGINNLSPSPLQGPAT